MSQILAALVAELGPRCIARSEKSPFPGLQMLSGVANGHKIKQLAFGQDRIGADHVSRSEGMAKEALRKPWNKPELMHLGEIKDVAGAQTSGPQGSATKS